MNLKNLAKFSVVLGIFGLFIWFLEFNNSIYAQTCTTDAIGNSCVNGGGFVCSTTCTNRPTQCATSNGNSTADLTLPLANTWCQKNCSNSGNCCEIINPNFGGGTSDYTAYCWVASGVPTSTPTPTPLPGSCGTANMQCCLTEPVCNGANLYCDENGYCKQLPDPPPPAVIPDYNPCDGVPPAVRGVCQGCVNGGGAYTALGCIPTGQGTAFAASIIRILFAISGGVAFLLMVYGAFICITSRGDPQKAQACRETITSAIVGLLMLLFALLIVRIVFGPGGFLPGIVTGVL